MQEIRGEAKTIRQLLSGTRYAVDYYQREYKWQPKQVRELIQDLTTEFLDDHEPTHDRQEVSSYGHYFLGSIIISARGTEVHHRRPAAIDDDVPAPNFPAQSSAGAR